MTGFMIARSSEDFTEDFDLKSPSLNIFEQGGQLDRYFKAKGLDYRQREAQTEMVSQVSEAMSSNQHLFVEAGTGVGKSFAYLVPALLRAIHTGQRVVISTNTISLQEQLINKDIPMLKEALGIPFNAVLVKGRQNYICSRRLKYALKQGGDLFDKGQYQTIEELHETVYVHGDGSRQSLPEQPSADVWSQICAEEGTCAWFQKKQPNCFLSKARQEMAEAQLLIVNHHLFFSDLAIRSEAAGFLPDYAAVVFDEGHTVEAVASEHMGIRLSHYAFDRWINRFYIPESRKGLFVAHNLTGLMQEAVEIRKVCEQAFYQLMQLSGLGPDKTTRRLHEPLGFETALINRILTFCHKVSDAIAELKDEDANYEFKSLIRRGKGLADAFDHFLRQLMEGHVYWMELEGKRQKYLVLKSSPVDVGDLLEEKLFSATDSVVCCSATMAVNDSLDFIKGRLGAADANAAILNKVFDYDSCMRVLIPTDIAPPEDPKFRPDCCLAISQLVRKTNGATMVLFTSAEFMKYAAQQLRNDFTEEGYELWVHGEQYSRSQLVEKFSSSPKGVLFGLDSFWMGVDIPGDNLKQVIITRLPFSVPDQPLTQARMDKLKDEGGNPFKELSIPEAILKFRQGIGRLIRTETDEGFVSILDSRIHSKWYGKYFMESLPTKQIEMIEIK